MAKEKASSNKSCLSTLLVLAVIAGLVYYFWPDSDPPQPNSGNNTSTKTETFTVNGVSFDMVKVKGGTFFMLITSEHVSDGSSSFQVTLSDYSIGKTEVTQALWQAVMGNNPSAFKGNLNCPVDNVSWNDCQMFITKLNRMTGKRFRLPKETEWEYAARGGKFSKGYKYSGSNNIGDVAWCSGNSNAATHPVATKSPNELGIHDMSGNVWEWVQDYYLIGANSGTTQISGNENVLRGGCWATNSTLSQRFTRNPMTLNNSFGLRIAL